MAKILIIAGDPSADLHGAQLVRALKHLKPDLQVDCLAGQRMRPVVDNFLFDLVGLSVFGPIEALTSFFRFNYVFRKIIVPYLQKEKPDLVVPIDFYGFNFPVIKLAKKTGAKIIYYISPQIWASRSYRKYNLVPYVDKMLVILPFEKRLYDEVGIKTTFVGHPLLDLLAQEKIVDQKRNPLTLGLFPGSRPSLVRQHLPLLLNIVRRLKTKFHNLEVLLFCAPEIKPALVQRMLNREQNNVTLIVDDDYTQRRKISIAIACSGTVTLENALLGIPSIVVYKTSWLFYFIARMLIHIKHISLANLIAGTKLLPEFIQLQADPIRITQIATNWLENVNFRFMLSRALYGLRTKLGTPPVNVKAATEIIEMLKETQSI